MAPEDAVAIVEHQRKVFNLKNLPVESLSGIKTALIAPGKCHRVTVPLDDPTNENSAIISFFETGVSHKDIKSELINLVIMQFMTQPFFNELRTNQQLGYVVDARAINNRHVMGYRFLV